MTMVDPPRLKKVTQCLDRERIRSVLNAAVDWPRRWVVSQVRVRRFTPRPNDSFDFEYAVELVGDGRKMNAELFGRCPLLTLAGDETGTGGRCALSESRSAESTELGVRGVFVAHRELNLSLHSMDRDPTLDQFAACTDVAQVIPRIAQVQASDAITATCGTGLQPVNVESTSWGCQVVSFRRGRRFVVRYGENQPRGRAGAAAPLGWAGKCYADDRGGRICERHRLLADHLDQFSGGRLQVPQRAAYLPDLRMVVTAWDHALPIDQAGLDGTAIARRAAEMLTAIHAAPIQGFRVVDGDRYAANLRHWCHLIDALCPALGDAARDCLDAVEDAAARFVPSPSVLTHGDFYEAQLVTDGEVTRLLDLDTLAVGDRCQDLGNGLAHLVWWCLERGHNLDAQTNMFRSFLHGYESAAGRVDDRALAYYAAATLFRIGAIHAFRDRWAGLVPSIWAFVRPVARHGRRAFDTVHHAVMDH